MPASLTRDYAAFAAAAASQLLPEAALDVVRLGFTDCAGVILAGRHEPVVQKLAAAARKAGSAGQSRLLFSAARGSMAQAGLINATAAHAQDFDDFAFSNHPSAVLVPTILAAADASGADGRRMAAAYAAGYEIWADIMKREADHLYDKGWHPTAVFGPLGAAVAASVALALSEKQTLHALALACSMAGGVFENFGTMAKPVHGGRAAEAGLTAAAFAAEGIEASPTALEGRHGLFRALTPAGRLDLDRAPALEGFPRLVTDRLNIKKYPVVGAAQRCIDAALKLRASENMDIAAIEKITPRISEKHQAVMPFHAPRTALEAKFSIEFAVACALLHGAVGLAELKDSLVQSPDMQALMAKVKPETTKDFAPDWPNAAPFDIVHVTLKSGRVISSPEIRRAAGHGDTPLSEAELGGKFFACAEFGGAPKPFAEKLYAAMRRIDQLKGSAEIAA